MIKRRNAADASAPPDSLLYNFQSHCFLLSLTFHRWGAQPQVRGADVEVGGVILAPGRQVTAPRWRLMPLTLKAEIDRLESKTRSTLDHISVPFFIKGVHVVPLNRAQKLFETLHRIREELDATVERLVRRGYDGLLGEIKDELGNKAFAVAQSFIPDCDEMVGRFGLIWAMIPLETGKHLGALGPAEAVEYVEEARAQLRQMLQESVEAMIRQPRKELAAAVVNLADLIDREGVRRGTLDRVQRAFEKLRGFQFLADAQLLDEMREVEQHLGDRGPRDLNRAKKEGMVVTTGLTAALRKLGDTASDLGAMDAAARPWRVLQL